MPPGAGGACARAMSASAESASANSSTRATCSASRCLRHDLMAAARAVGHDQVARPALRTAGSSESSAICHRHVDRLRAIAEGARHAAAARLDRPDLEARDRAQRRLDGAHRGKGLLVAMAVQMSDARRPGPCQTAGLIAPGIEIDGEQLLEQQGCALLNSPRLPGRGAGSHANSSRKVSRQEGSSPTIRAPLPDMNGEQRCRACGLPPRGPRRRVPTGGRDRCGRSRGGGRPSVGEDPMQTVTGGDQAHALPLPGSPARRRG